MQTTFNTLKSEVHGEVLGEVRHTLIAEVDNVTSLMVGGSRFVAKSLVGIGAIYVGYKIVKHALEINRDYGTAPYSISQVDGIRGQLQRRIIDLSRKTNALSLFPTDSILTSTPRRSQDNGHAQSGAVRDEARRTITSFISSLGYVKHELSPAIQSPGGTAEHWHIAPSDLGSAARRETPHGKSVVVGIDIDYYVTDPRALLGLGMPMILHTFQPRKVSGMDADSSFTISDNLVKYEVSGGGVWTHPVWNWCAHGEFIRTTKKTTGLKEHLQALLWGIIGIETVVVHKIMHSRPWVDCPDRALVWTSPNYTYKRFRFIPDPVQVRSLEKVQFASVARPGWNEIMYVDRSGDDARCVINVGREGELANLSLSKSDFDIIMGCKTPQAASQRMLTLNLSPMQNALLSQYYNGYLPTKRVVVDYIASPSQPKVHWTYSTLAEVPEVSARNYASPLVSDHNLMPMIKRWETMSVSIDRRVTDHMQGRSINFKPPSKYAAYAVEFINLVCPEQGNGEPYTVDQTAEMLNKPSQILAVKQIWETLDVPTRSRIESFLKNEPTNKCGRIISSFPDIKFLLYFSRFTLKFRDQVLHAPHNQHWFCPGSAPADIANKVQEYCIAIGDDKPLEGDYSNFDGTVTAWCQTHVMNAMYHRYFAQNHLSELRDYTHALVTCPANAKRFGFKYDPGYGVKSGSPTTCDLNSVLNAFVMYCAVRTAEHTWTGEDCFRSIGLAFGDDSLFQQRYRNFFCQSAKQLGLKLKVESYQPEQGVCFLARVFPDPVNTITSFQDPLRTWRKLHLTSRDPNIPLADAAMDRVEGYLITDPLTPVTSNFCRMIQRCYLKLASDKEARQKRVSHHREKPYWLTEGGSWPQQECDVDLMFSCIAARTGIPEETLTYLMGVLDSNNDVWSGYTVNSDSSEQVWSNTITPDGDVADAEVDPVKLQSDNQNAKLRANKETSRGNRQGDKPRYRGYTKGQNRRRSVASGSSGFSSMSGGSQRQDKGSDKQPFGKATPNSCPPRKGATPEARRGPPGAAGKAAPSTGSNGAQGGSTKGPSHRGHKTRVTPNESRA